LARVGHLARLRGDWPPTIERLFGRGLAPVNLPGLSVVSVVSVCPSAPGNMGRVGLLGRLAGVCSDWGGLVGPGSIGAGLALGRLGGAGRLAPLITQTRAGCNDFPAILPFL